jgi:hypothetical protein
MPVGTSNPKYNKLVRSRRQGNRINRNIDLSNASQEELDYAYKSQIMATH